MAFLLFQFVNDPTRDERAAFPASDQPAFTGANRRLRRSVPRYARFVMLGLLPFLACLTLAARSFLMVEDIEFSLSDGALALRESKLDQSVIIQAKGWKSSTIQKLPEKVSSLLIMPKAVNEFRGRVFAGTAHTGSLHMFTLFSGGTSTRTIAAGLGDSIDDATCVVNRLAVHDTDHDGTYELYASTSQIYPAGRPRLYAWNLDKAWLTPLGMARPQITSRWGHGIAFASEHGSMTGSAGDREGAFITFCGDGEVVEYRLATDKSDSGFSTQTIGWKIVGQLPASGEWSQSDDVDGDGHMDIALATGYGEGLAEIHVYSVHEAGQPLVLEHRIIEEGRFSNVRFISTSLRQDGTKELFAWWQTDHLYGGDSEMVSYKIGPQGVRSRKVITTGTAAELQPEDGQYEVADIDQDGNPELWFASLGGKLLKYEPENDLVPEVMLQLEGGIGPLAVGPADAAERGGEAIYLGWGSYVVRFAPEKAKP